MAKEYGIKPWELHQAPAFWFERMKFKMQVERQAEKDRQENEKASSGA